MNCLLSFSINSICCFMSIDILLFFLMSVIFTPLIHGFLNVFLWQGYFSEKPDTNFEHIDLTLKLSPYGQNVQENMIGEKVKSNMITNEAQDSNFVLCLAEGEKGLVRFGDLQTMRRVRTGKRLLLKKLRMAAAAAAEAEKSLPVSPASDSSLPHSIDDNLKMFAIPSGDSWHEGGASFNVETIPKKQGNDCMVSPKAMQEMTLWPSETMIERPAKKLKHVNCYDKSDEMNIVREMPSVITSGDGTTGKRIEGLLYKYNKRGHVCIVCACHGRFLSPTEFVMHDGGKEVVDPMKHITVCSSDSFYINGDGAGFITHPF